MNLGEKFKTGLTYHDFLHKYGNDEQRRRWQSMHEKIVLSDFQKELLRSWVREMKVFCFAGTWCGDCVNQCPIFDHFQIVNPLVQVRYFDRDANPDLGQMLSVCGGARVPVLLFVSEDDHQVGMYGDRTISKYRSMAETQLAAACPTGLVGDPGSLLQAVVQDWLNEFERIQLILRLSSRLRQKHGD